MTDVERTRTAYDTVAASYATLLEGLLDGQESGAVWDRAVLGVFAERVLAAGGGPVLDAGCGPGRITRHLAGLGLDASGVDLSPGMVAEARRRHPDLILDVGSIESLDRHDGALSGLCAWYSIIHTPPARHGIVLAEFARVVRPGGQLVMAFQTGDDERVTHAQAYGHEVDYDAYRLAPQRICQLLDVAGFDLQARTDRAAEGFEKTPQTYLLAQRR